MSHARTKPSAAMARVEAEFSKLCKSYPEATEDFPWGDHVFKVRGKIFVFLSADAEGFGVTVKLPHSNALALALPFTEPTGYGLGKSGWISARMASLGDIDHEMIRAWIDESYRAIAPKKLAAMIGAASVAAKAAPKKVPSKKKAAPKAKKAVKRKR